MLLKIAWRNIWRNKRRSVIVLGSVVVGAIAVILTEGLTNGFLRQMLYNQLNTTVSHIQIHKEGFQDNKTIQNYIPDNQKVEQTLNQNSDIESYSGRVLTFGLLSSARNSSGIYIYGVDHEKESKVSDIEKYITKGKFLTGAEREIVLGQELADKLNVDIGSKVVAMSNTPGGDIGSELFRVSGIFETFSSGFDKINVYVPIEAAQSMLNLGNHVHEYALITSDYHKVDQIAGNIGINLSSSYEVMSYKDILPLLIMQMNLSREMMFFVNLIIGIALIFGIINTMLMSVFERIQEFGVLMSIGMKNGKIFGMIMLEALMIGIIGTIAGLALGLLIHIPLAYTGIDLSVFAESLTSLGVGAVIYPILDFSSIINVLIFIPVVSVIGAIYPAVRAIRLDPIYAVRYV